MQQEGSVNGGTDQGQSFVAGQVEIEYAKTMSCAGGPAGWRITMPELLRGLQMGSERLPGGMLLSYYDFTPEEDIAYDFEMVGGTVQFGGVLSGQVRLSDADGTDAGGVVLDSAQETVLRLGDMAGQGRIQGGSCLRMFALILSEELLAEVLSGVGEWERFLDLAGRNSGLKTLNRATLSPSFKMLAAQFLQCPLQGGLRQLYLEGKALELLALQLDRIVGESRPRTPLSRSDIDRLHAARRFLFERMEEPPGLRELAAHACLNEFKLKRGFREVFGTTVYGALREHRLESARAMLLDSDMTVGTTAAAVGYTNMSHFISLFRERFGVTPGALTKQSRRAYRRS